MLEVLDPVRWALDNRPNRVAGVVTDARDTSRAETHSLGRSPRTQPMPSAPARMTQVTRQAVDPSHWQSRVAIVGSGTARAFAPYCFRGRAEWSVEEVS